MARMLTMALAAVGLSVGGFEIGSTHGAPRKSSVELPPDHPLAAAIEGTSASDISQSERDRLARVTVGMEQARLVAMQDARNQADTEAKRLQAVLEGQQLQVIDLSKKYKLTQPQIASLRKQSAQQKAELEKAYKQLAEAQREVQKQIEQRRLAQVDKQYSDMALQQMTPKIQDQVKAAVRAKRDMDEERGFGLLIALRSREDLNLTPHQVTQLQLLQAEFIKRFAPIREAYESRVDSTKWEWKGDYIEGKPPASLSYKLQYDVETSGYKVDTSKVPAKYFVQYVTTTDKAVKGKPVKSTSRIVGEEKGKLLRYYVTTSLPQAQPKAKNLFIRYFVWMSNDSLEKQLASLKKEIDGRALKVLNETQRQKLQELINQSLVPGK